MSMNVEVGTKELWFDTVVKDIGSHIDVLRAIVKESDHDEATLVISQITEVLLEKTGSGLSLSDKDLSDLNLAGFDLRSANLNRARLYGTDLSHANLHGASLICPGLERTNFAGADLSEAYIHAFAAQVCNFSNAILTNLSDCTGSLFHGCTMVNAQLAGSPLAGSTFYQCDLTGASFASASLQGATFNECCMDATDLSDSHVSQVTVTKCALNGATFQGANGDGVALNRCPLANDMSLNSATLPSLTITDCSFVGLKAASLDASGASVNNLHLLDGQLSGAIFERSLLNTVSFRKSNFQGANFNQSLLVSSSLDDCDLSRGKGENISVIESNLSSCNMHSLSARCLTVRDSMFQDCSFKSANLYRAMITGDPPRNMILRNIDFSDCILVQAYLAARFDSCRLNSSKMTYARINQSVFSDSEMQNVALYEVSAIKTVFEGTPLGYHDEPVFSDRCKGLLDALDASPTREFCKKLEALISEHKVKST